jgi:hypothetical protein
MGGQACVLYGAAEFSRDTDLAILASAANFERLAAALRDLRAEVIAVPPFEAKYLRRGHAVHFRCQDAEAAGMRVDVMTKMRGVAPFSSLWSRRTSLTLPDGTRCEVMGLSDLVQAKKTQRDKDWPMVRRLIEAHYFQNREQATTAQVRFWLRELRTPAAKGRARAPSAPALGWQDVGLARPPIRQSRRRDEAHCPRTGLP